MLHNTLIQAKKKLKKLYPIHLNWHLQSLLQLLKRILHIHIAKAGKHRDEHNISPTI